VKAYLLEPPTCAGMAVWSCATRASETWRTPVFAAVAECAPAAEYLLAKQAGRDVATLLSLESHAHQLLRALGHEDADVAEQLQARACAYKAPKTKRCASSRHEFGITAGIRLAHILSEDCLTHPAARREALVRAAGAHPNVERLLGQDPAKIDFPAADEIRRALAGDYGDPSYLLAGFCLGLGGCVDRAAALHALRSTFSVILTPSNLAAQELFKC
jgi:hypothetical protein